MRVEEAVERIWPGRPVEVEPLGGGITNHNFKVVVDGETLVLRIGGKDTELLGIDRAREHEAALLAAELGIGPEVARYEDGVLVTRFAEGDVGRAEPSVVGGLLRRLHSARALAGRFDSFRVVEAYAATAAARGLTLPDQYDRAHELAHAIEARRSEAPLVTCHNDLLAANFIDDGNRIWIVDWEYAAMGDPFFDLANFAVNNGLDEEGERSLLAAYGSADAAALVLMRFMSDFREAMWGVVQQAISELDFDFVAYADEHFERMLRTASEPPVPGGPCMRERAKAVVIGGGVGGCAVAYWLTRLGWDDVVLCERADLTSGSTFHSAGLVGQLRGSLSLTRMMMASVDLYRTLGDEVGLETGWHEVGSLRLASSEERMEELRRQAGWAKTFGLPLELISARKAKELFPPMTADGVLGAAYLPTDGYIDPSQLTLALAAGARSRGAEIATHTRVTGIEVDRGRVAGVETDKGAIQTEVVVNAGGMFAAELGRLAGVTVPIVPMAHEYLITKPHGVPLEVPTLRDPSLLVYFRGESGGLVMGGYERHPAPWGLDGIPSDFNGRLLAEDWDRFEELMTNALVRVPELADAEVIRLVNGPEAFTPDGEFILGPTELRGFWVAAGFCAHGLAGAGGMGKLVAEWIVEGLPSLDVWEMDSRRFGAHYASRDYTLARTVEVYSTYYDVKYPGHERASRPAAPPLPRLSPARRARRGVRREVGLGARELVRAERRGGRRVAQAARMGGTALVARDRRRAPRLPGDSSALRRDELRQDRDLGRGSGRLPRASVRQPRRPRGRADHVHLDAERPRRDRVRLHGHPPGRGSLPDRHRHRLRQARPGLDPRARARRRLRRRRGHHVASWPASGSGGRPRARSSRR